MNAESLTDNNSPTQMSRAIMTLQNAGWTYKEISEILKLPEKKVRAERAKCVRPEKLNRTTWRLWSEQTALQAVYNFIQRENRWPIARDFRLKNDLPAMSTIRWPLFRGNHQNWSRNAISGYDLLQQKLVRSRKYKLTTAQILGIPNVTIRREAIEKIGFNKLIKENAVEKISKDDFGILWKIPTPGKEEDMVIVEVINATKEPNGTFAHYFLRVPPDMTTPHQAVAWSFGVPTDGEWKEFKVEVAT